MEEQSHGSSVAENNSFPKDIRIIELNLQARLRDFEIPFEEAVQETSTICDCIKDYILNYKDESHLSKSQNNYRRIEIASRLTTEICFSYGNIVDFDLTKILNDLLGFERFKSIYLKITQRANLKLKREKYFKAEAKERLLKFVEDETNLENTATADDEKRHSKDQNVEGETLRSQIDATGTLQVEATATDINISMGKSPSEISRRSDPPCELIGNMTELREEPAAETFNIQVPSPNVPEVSLGPTTEPEISVRESSIHPETEEDVYQILQVLEDRAVGKELDSIRQPENSLEPPDKDMEEVGTGIVEGPLGPGKAVNGLEVSDDWSLPSTEPEEHQRKRKKPSRLVIDPVVTIRHYAARALELNSQIQIERVQVYEGPPRFLKAFTVDHVMTTPGFRSSVFHRGRSSRLNALYERHLRTERKPSETLILPQKRQPGEQERGIDASKPPTVTTEITEEFGNRRGMHSLPERSILAEAPERPRPENLDFSAVEVPNRETLVGVPLSRMMTLAVEPPDLEKINVVHPHQSPRAKNLQGKTLVSDGTPPWCFTAEQRPPSQKWRNFKYVDERLREYWKLCEMQGTEKTIGLREFFSLEGSNGVSNYLTLLRILDKLSIERKLFLHYQNEEILIKPFEVPYVSEKQFALRGKQPIF